VRTIRLLPVVVCATAALLAFKSIGLMTQGGYVLTGVGEAVAAGPEPAGEAGAVQLIDPTAEDSSPTLADRAPTVDPTDIAGTHGLAEGGEEAEDPIGANAVETGHAASPQVVADEQSEPLDAMGGGATERSLLERLAERRTELDAYAAELEMRADLIEAAEKRIEERAATMEALEAQIASLVEARKAAEEELVTGIVAMYETMRPRDAATIFNELDINVLLQVSRAMAPRKMAPILAAMNPTRAQELTVRLAAVRDEPADRMTPDDFAALPQIVGQ
jgi:flagellar motility protein MotE (MotC chaperone)